MKNRILALIVSFAVLTLFCSHDGTTQSSSVHRLRDVKIGLIAAGGFDFPLKRLDTLGLTNVTVIPPTSGITTFHDFDVIYLACDWAQFSMDFDTIEKRADDYHQYVKEGGNLFVEQPNPGMQLGNTTTPTILPYPITFMNDYFSGEEPEIVDSLHFIVQGVTTDSLPFPADQITSVDSSYHIIVRGNYGHSPSLLVSEYGKGRILIHGLHVSRPNPHTIGNRALTRMLMWVSRTEDSP